MSKPGRTLKSSGSSRLLLVKAPQERSESVEQGEPIINIPAIDHDLPLRLTDLELREEIVRTLTTFDPQAPKNAVVFSFKDQGFVRKSKHDHFLTHYYVESTCLHRDSEAAREQLSRTDTLTPAAGGKKNSEEKVEEEEEAEPEGDAPAEEGAAENPEPKAESPPKEEAPPPEPEPATTVPPANLPKKKLTNQFNFCERGSLTTNNPSKDAFTQTNPPPHINFSASVTQWGIYDAYLEEHTEQEKEKREKREKEKSTAAPLGPQKKEEPPKKDSAVVAKSVVAQPTQGLAAKILERMSNQNTYDEVIHDFKYWQDPSDDFKEEEGTLLPLWKFDCEKAHNYTVTSFCWNDTFSDMFAAGFGSFEFKPYKSGLMCMFTLKNPSYPEHLVFTESEVLSVDIHHTNSSLVALGLLDGNIEIYDMTKSCTIPQYGSSSVSNKHAAAVWQVRWCKDANQSELTLFSISADGQVLCWTLMQNDMIKMTLISLNFPSAGDSVPDAPRNIRNLTGCGSTLAFHPSETNIFLVGTEEGRIYKCSTAYTSIFLTQTEAHYMPVQQIEFNKYDPSVYASCSSDWRVKIWEDERKEPLFEFDLGAPVEDVAWAPYSSTVLAAVTANGRIHVFDLNVNKYQPLCIQIVAQKKKCKLTKVSFNPKHLLLVIGDSSGGISSFKMSPNLRKKQKPPKKGMVVDHDTLEKLKLEKLLSLVREPSKPITVLDTDSGV